MVSRESYGFTGVIIHKIMRLEHRGRNDTLRCIAYTIKVTNYT